MITYRPPLDTRTRLAARLIGAVTSEIQRAYESAKRRGPMTQSALATALGVDRATVHRQLVGGGNLQLRTLSDYAWALGCRADVKLVPLEAETAARRNHEPQSGTLASTALNTASIRSIPIGTDPFSFERRPRMRVGTSSGSGTTIVALEAAE